jgi:hypothetical protein
MAGVTGYSKTRVKAMYEMLETSLYLAISHPQLGMLGLSPCLLAYFVSRNCFGEIYSATDQFLIKGEQCVCNLLM